MNLIHHRAKSRSPFMLALASAVKWSQRHFLNLSILQGTVYIAQTRNGGQMRASDMPSLEMMNIGKKIRYREKNNGGRGLELV